ncbi:MAG: cache domain-containing protein [Nocardioides sp.]
MTTQALRPVLDVIDAVAGEAFGLTGVVEAFIAEHLAGQLDEGPLAASVSGLRSAVETHLTTPGARVVGAGFVAAIGVFADRPWWLEWLVREGALVQRLQVPLGPEQPGFYDYTTTSWFREPERDGRRHVIGPFVDYLCTEDLTITFSQPVTVDGRFVGVAACDVRAVTVERELLPVLRRLEHTYIVANDDRVLCSNSGRYVCGDLLAADAARRRHGLEGLPLTIVEPA